MLNEASKPTATDENFGIQMLDPKIAAIAANDTSGSSLLSGEMTIRSSRVISGQSIRPIDPIAIRDGLRNCVE